MNIFVAIGRWSQPIELRYTSSGKAVASSSLAINEKRGQQESTVFLRVVIWDKLAEIVAQHSDKGRLVGIRGRISTRSYDNREGQKINVTEVIADSVDFLDRSDGVKQNADKPQQSQQKPQTVAKRYDDDPFADDGQSVDIVDDDLPF